MPTDDVIGQFHEIVAPMHGLATILRREAVVLRATRDLLLPRLVSGDIDVSNLDIDVGDAAA